METLSVRCNHCGAPLQAAETTRFVTCQFCHSSLEVRRTDTSIFTAEIAKVAANTGKMAENLEAIKLQNEIDRLDRKHAGGQVGSVQRGTGIVGAIGLIMVTAFGLFFAFGSAKAGAPWIFQVFGGGFALIGLISLGRMVLGSTNGTSDASSHALERKRAELELRLETITKG